MDMGKGTLRKRGHRVPEDCCLCSYLLQIGPETSSLWEGEPFSFHQGCCPPSLNALKGLHGATGIYLVPEIAPSENRHYLEKSQWSASILPNLSEHVSILNFQMVMNQ